MSFAFELLDQWAMIAIKPCNYYLAMPTEAMSLYQVHQRGFERWRSTPICCLRPHYCTPFHSHHALSSLRRNEQDEWPSPFLYLGVLRRTDCLQQSWIALFTGGRFGCFSFPLSPEQIRYCRLYSHSEWKVTSYRYPFTQILTSSV